MSTVSWSEDRSGTHKEIESPERRIEKLALVNGMLNHLANDEDFHDDLKLEIVSIAVNHWTGMKRLPPEEAIKLQRNRRVAYCFERIAKFQQCCKEAGMATPLDNLLQRQRKLPYKLVQQHFGDDLLGNPMFPMELYANEITLTRNPPPITNMRSSGVPAVPTSSDVRHVPSESGNQNIRNINQEKKPRTESAIDTKEIQIPLNSNNDDRGKVGAPFLIPLVVIIISILMYHIAQLLSPYIHGYQ